MPTDVLPLERPTSLEVAFWFWVTLAVLTLLSGLGIAILIAVFCLRSGSRFGRTLLTVIGVVFGVPMILGPLLLMVISGAGWVVIAMAIMFLPGALFIAATILMWTEKTSAYLRVAQAARAAA